MKEMSFKSGVIIKDNVHMAQSQLRVKQSLVKAKASQPLHMQSALRRRTFHWSVDFRETS